MIFHGERLRVQVSILSKVNRPRKLIVRKQRLRVLKIMLVAKGHVIILSLYAYISIYILSYDTFICFFSGTRSILMVMSHVEMEEPDLVELPTISVSALSGMIRHIYVVGWLSHESGFHMPVFNQYAMI